MKLFCKIIMLFSIFLRITPIHSMDTQERISLPGISWQINPRIINPEKAAAGITIVCHGWGGSGDLAHYLSAEKIVPGTLITFEMIDSTAEGSVALSKANFGQKNDTKALAAVCVYAYKLFKEVPWHMYGISRGGATVANMLGQLVAYKVYASDLQMVDMTAKLATSIIEKLQHGTIILDRPLHSVSRVVSNKVDDVLSSSLEQSSSSFSSLSGYVPGFVKSICSMLYISSRESIAASVDCVSLPLVTQGNYVPWGDSPLKSALFIQPFNFNILVHIQNPDDVLGNDATVETFCKNLRGPNTHYAVLTGQGHNGFDQEIKSLFAQFRLCCQGSTSSLQDDVEHSNLKIIKKRLQPDDAMLHTLLARQ